MSDEQLIQKMGDVRALKMDTFHPSRDIPEVNQVQLPAAPKLADEFSPPATVPKPGTQQVDLTTLPPEGVPAAAASPGQPRPIAAMPDSPAITPQSPGEAISTPAAGQIAPSGQRSAPASSDVIPMVGPRQIAAPEIKQAAIGLLDRLSKMTPAEVMDWKERQKSSGNFTQRAIEVGRALQDSPEIYRKFIELSHEAYKPLLADLGQNDPTVAGASSILGQFYSEAYQYATNTEIALSQSAHMNAADAKLSADNPIQTVPLKEVSGPLAAPDGHIPVVPRDTIPPLGVKQQAAEVVKNVKSLNLDEAAVWAKGLSGDNSATTRAIETGMAFHDDPTQIRKLKEEELRLGDQINKAIDHGEMESIPGLQAKYQFFREAYEYATDTGSAASPKGREAVAKSVARTRELSSEPNAVLGDSNSPADINAPADTGARVNPATLHLQPQPGVTKLVSAPDVIKSLDNILESVDLSPKSIRFGRVNKRNSRGFYRPFDRIIRVQQRNNIATAAHEVAHAIEDKVWGTGHVWKQDELTTTQSRGELEKLGRDLYGPEAPHNGFESEGFAEFFRLWLTDPEKAMQLAPSFSKVWQEKILPAYPKLDTYVGRAQEAGTAWHRQGSIERVRHTIVPPKTETQKALAAARNELAAFRRHWIDSSSPIHDLVEIANKIKPIAPEDNPLNVLISRRMSADQVVHVMATRGMMDWAGNIVGPALTEAFRIARKDPEGFVLYLYAKRAKALWEDPNGPRNPGILKEDADEVIRQFDSPSFQIAADHVYEWENGLLNYASEASPDYVELVKEIRKLDVGFYLPLFREFEAFDKRYGTAGGVKGKALIKHLKGSTRRTRDPVESMLANAKAIVLKSQQKAILDRIIQIIKTTPGLGPLATKVPVDQLPAFSKKVENVDEDFLKAIDRLREEGVSINLDDDILTFFTPAYFPTKQSENPVIPIFANGKREWWEMDHQLYAGLSGMDQVHLPAVINLTFGTFARTVRMGTTGFKASFSLGTNLIKDLRSLQVNSQASANSAQLFGYWMQSMVEAAIDILSGGKFESKWLKIADQLAISHSGSLTQDTPHMRLAVASVKRGGRFNPLSPKEYVEMLRELLQVGETASRVAEMRALGKDIDYNPSMPLTTGVHDFLGIAGRQVTTDFTQSGEYTRAYNQVTPYTVAAIAGPTASVRALKRNPKKFILRALEGTVAVLTTWWVIKDEKWFKEMTAKERYSYTYIPVGKDLIRVPRSFEVDGIFMAGATAAADAWYRNDPKKATEWFSQFFQQSTNINMVNGFPVPPLPPPIQVTAEELANRNFYFDSPIVPRGQLENLPPAKQFNEYSSNAAIAIGKLFNISPRRIDHVINGIFGSVGGDIAKIFGQGGLKQIATKDSELADTPIFGVFFQRGGQVARSPESIERLYDLADAANRNRGLKGAAGETPNEKQVRLALNDAIRTQAAIAEIARTIPDRDRRNYLLDLRIKVAQMAVRMAKSGQVDRGAIKSIFNEFKPALRAAKKANP